MDLSNYIGLTRRVWRQILSPFAVAFITLTALMLLNQTLKQQPLFREMQVPGATMLRVCVLSAPFVVAITLPMALLIAVLRVFTRHASDRVLPQQLPGATPTRLVLAVLAGATLVGGLLFLWNNTVLPRANHELRLLLVDIRSPGAATVGERDFRGDRELSVTQLREVVRSAERELSLAEADGNEGRAHAARQRAAIYAVEIQKKLAISAACIVFAFLGTAVGLRIRGGGWPVVIAVAFSVFSMEYVGLIGGEELGDRLIVPPFLAMWTVDLALVLLALGLLWSMKSAAGATRQAVVPRA